VFCKRQLLFSSLEEEEEAGQAGRVHTAKEDELSCRLHRILQNVNNNFISNKNKEQLNP
jgi:hypothetical protein